MKLKTDIIDKAPTILEIAYSAGSLVGPIVGGGLYDIDGFTFTTLVVAALSFLFSIAFLLIMFCNDCYDKKYKFDDAAGPKKKTELLNE